MIAPTEKELMALIRLQNSADFQVVAAWMYNSFIKQSLVNNHNPDDGSMRQMQGRNLELEEFINLYKGAEDTLKRLQKPKPGMV